MIDLQDEEPTMVERMLLYLYVLDYNTGPSTSLQPDTVPQVDKNVLNAELRTHVTMYAMADRYDIPSLSVVAKAKLAARVREIWPIPGLPEIANEVFTSVPACDRGLKDIVLQICVSHATEIVNQLTSKHPANDRAHNSAGSSEEESEELCWSNVLTNNGDLTIDMLTHVVKESDAELNGLREAHEDTVGQLQKAENRLEAERERYEDLMHDFVEYKTMIKCAVKTKLCSCNGGYRIYMMKGTSFPSCIKPPLRLTCVTCRARSA